MENGEWVTTAKVTVKVEAKEEKKMKVAKNGFAALESDEEEKVEKEKEVKSSAAEASGSTYGGPAAAAAAVSTSSSASNIKYEVP
jgi:hypothetical protein